MNRPQALFSQNIVSVVITTVFALLLCVHVHADSLHATGQAWSDTIGWIIIDDGIPQDNTSAVNVDSVTGAITGYAWSENVGWVNFSPSSGYPEAPMHGAQLDPATGVVTGWIRACSGSVNGDCTGGDRSDGWDGWIKMAGTAANTGTYGVSYSTTTNKFSGYAWGSDVVGWIAFTSGGTILQLWFSDPRYPQE